MTPPRAHHCSTPTSKLEAPFDVFFDEVQVGHYEADLLAEHRVLVEVKATHHLSTPIAGRF